MSEPCLRFNRDGFQPDHEQQLSEVERGFDSYVRARKKSIEVFRLAAVRLDEIAQVRKGLKIGEGVTTHMRAIARENPLLQGIIDRVDFNATTHGQRERHQLVEKWNQWTS